MQDIGPSLFMGSAEGGWPLCHVSVPFTAEVFS